MLGGNFPHVYSQWRNPYMKWEKHGFDIPINQCMLHVSVCDWSEIAK